MKIYRKDENGNWVPLGDGKVYPIEIPEYNPTEEEKEKWYKKGKGLISFTATVRKLTDQEILALGKIFEEGEGSN